ncbi:universal stress protein [Natronobiforma cellulositropha]
MRVLVPIDGSPQAGNALAEALELFPDATITLLHVVDPIDGDGDENASVAAHHESQRERAERLFDAAKSRADSREATLETAVVAGSPWREIVTYADDHDIDHVVMGSHGRGGAARFLLGSVAELVVRRASVPVTVIK